MFSDSTRQLIVISEQVKDYIHMDTLSDAYELQFFPDITISALEEVIEARKPSLFLLLFIHTEEIKKVYRFLSKQKSSDFLFKIVLISPDGCEAEKAAQYDDIIAFHSGGICKGVFNFLTNKAFQTIEREILKHQVDELYATKLADMKNDQDDLIEIGRALSLEKDSDELLRKILMLSKKITGADAGSIFIVEEHDDEKILRFKYSHTTSKDLAYEEFTMPMDTRSIAGYVAVTGEVLNIPDVYSLGEDDPVSFNPSFDIEHGYQTKSMLVLPMRNHLDKIIGVIQLINSKEMPGMHTGNEAFEIRLVTQADFVSKIANFDTRYETLMEAVAGQAAIALENNRMLLQIEHQFEEFVKASVTAIESRDPATSGHSFRIAEMCVRTAKVINDCTEGPFKDISYNDAGLKEIEFAGLLHDFGKVYIDPAVFIKAKKLYPRDFDYLMMRLNFLYRSIELKCEQENCPESLIKQKLAQLGSIMEELAELNEPKVTDDDPDQIINKILGSQRELSGVDLAGMSIPLLEDSEIVNLRIKRGSLNPEERKIIESHVEHTYTFVSKIPWPDEYKAIPDIACKHHEKLDGSGYPAGIKDKQQIPIAARIMAIADIFDALNASDRPYKNAIPLEKIFTILRQEGDAGKLDSDLVELFITSKAWDLDN